MAAKVICPVCGRADPVGKVSAIYIHALETKKADPSGGEQMPDVELAPLSKVTKAELLSLGKRLAPPASPRRMPTRTIHPDQMVLVFTLVLPFFLARIASDQPGMLLPMLGLLAVAYAAYFWKRRLLIEKFERQQTAQKASAERVTRGIERWMRLYYCFEDDAVFESGSRQSAPADMIAGYLLRE